MPQFLVPLCLKVDVEGDPSLPDLIRAYAREERHHDQYAVNAPSTGKGIWDFCTYSEVENSFPATKGELYTTSGEAATRFALYTYNSTNTFGSSYRGARARGTSGNPSGILAGDVMIQVVGDGYVAGSGFKNSAGSLAIFAAEDWVSGKNGSYITLRTTPTGATQSQIRLQINHNGNIGVNNTSPQYSLDVSGIGNFSQGLYVNGVPVGTGGGETNVGSNLGAGSGWYGGKNGVNLEFKSIKVSGPDLSITGSSSELCINFIGSYASQTYVNDASGVLSARINSTGTNLLTQITALNSQTGLYAMAANTGNFITAAQTGAFYPLIGNPSNFAMAANLATTGGFLEGKITSLSGYSNSTFGTIANLAGTGSFLEAKIASLSGYSNTTFATVNNLAATESSLQSQINTINGAPKVTGVGYAGSFLVNGVNLAASGIVQIALSGNNILIGAPAGGGGGEANTASNLGAGSGLFSQKAGVDLQFKSVFAGSGIQITGDANTLFLNVTGIGGAVASSVPMSHIIVSATQTLTNMAAALTEVASAPRYVFDLTNATEARYSIYVPTNGTPASRMGLQYGVDGTNWTGLLPTWASLSGTVAAARVTPWEMIPAAAKGDKMFRLVTISGDGVADPIFRGFALQTR